MAKWSGFKSGEVVEYKKNGYKYLATVAENYTGAVDPGCVPVVPIPEGCLLCVPADSLTRR